MSTDTIDSSAEEIGAELATIPPAGLFRTDDPVEVVERATVVANALADVIERRGLYTMIQGKKHVRVEGWQLVGAMLGVTAVCVHTEPADGGFKAIVEARTADDRVIGRADAICSKNEKRGPWKGADDYARLSMAQTRATSKALKGPLGFVVSLAGYESTPAEEMTFAAPDPPAPAVALPDPVLRDLRAAYRDSGLDVEGLRLLLVAAGAQDTSDVRRAMRELTVEQAGRLADLIGREANRAR